MERNNGGVSVLYCAVGYEMLVVNSIFKKKEDHLVTFKSGLTRTQIDYFLVRVDIRRLCKDYKMIPSEYLGIQPWLLVLDWSLNVQSGRK